MSWFEKLLPSVIKTDGKTKGTVPEGLWTKCPSCNAVLYRAELERNLDVCPKCTHHMRVRARWRLEKFLDEDSLTEVAKDVKPVDELKFKDSIKYKDRITQAQRKTKENDALVVMQGRIENIPVVACSFDFAFMGGSMGAVVGEKFLQAVNVCLEQKIPLICFSQSGGARMQEALFALMQMVKTSAALKKLSKRKVPYISILTEPTMGGVSASLAMLGDIHIAEPNALIGFAGPRVIEQTVREVLPEGFQRSEFLLEKGAIDMIVDRRDLRAKVAKILLILGCRSADQ